MKKLIFLFFSAFLICAEAVHANGDFLDYIAPDLIPLSGNDLRALERVEQWADGGASPYLGAGGKLLYVHGASLPTVIGSPMQVVDVELQSGENIHEIIVGDSARWMVESGEAGNTPHLFIKPIDAGLETSVVVTTNIRAYHLRLISRRNEHTPYVGFIYSDDLRQAQAQDVAEQARNDEWNTLNESGSNKDLSLLNFNYDVDGSANWKPERIYDDGQQTYIMFPENTAEMPILLVKKSGENILVNYRVSNNAMIVDGTFEHMVLIVGVGSDQEKIDVREI